MLALLSALFTSREAAADVGDCETLGVALTEHSCFHSKFGPFDTVEASPGTTPSATTTNIDSVHTEFRVVLADRVGLNVVTYAPVRSGQWVVFTASDIPLIIEDSTGEPLPLLRSDEGTTGCDALPIARTFELTAGERYSFLLGPHDTREAMLVVEYANDFLVAHSRDRDADGYGNPAETTEPSTCAPKDGWAAKTGDCDDTDPEVHPGARETCDDVDRNCNGLTDDVGLHCRSGTGACEATGVFACGDHDGDQTVCGADAGAPIDESCNGVDDDCDGLIDEDDDLCGGSEAPSCVRHEMGRFCGCLVDADCGSPSSGRICDADTRTCQDGCRISSMGNGCPDGQECETAEGMPTRCVAAKPEEPEEEPEPPDDPTGEGTTRSGCSCHAHGHSRGRSGAIGLGLLVFLLLVRRRRAVIALAALGAGCGGQVSTTAGHDTTDETQCQLVLAEDPIDHACSHGSHGPYESVVAASLDVAEAPAVDAVHVPYTIDLRGGEDGWVSYHARRDGEHVVFLSSASIELRGQVLEDGSWTDIETTGVRLAKECPALEQGYMLEFESGNAYRLIIYHGGKEPTLDSFDLFVEHLGTFSGDSLSAQCQ